MQIWGVTHADVERAADAVGVRVEYGTEAGRSFRFRRATVGRPPLYGRRGHTRNKDGARRRIPGAVCWHGHRDFMRELFRAHPAARLKTALADYRGAESFEEQYRDTGERNAGSMMDPIAVADDGAPEGSDSAGSVLLRTARVCMIPRSAIMACPHCIMVPEHYREDATCRCDDPAHLAMAEWGYTWNAGAWVAGGGDA